MEPAAEQPPSDRRTWRALAACALVGAVLFADGLARGELRHRLVGAAVGLTLVLPLASAWVSGERALRAWRRCALSGTALVAALLVAEATVRIFDVRAFSVVTLVPDPVLGHAQAPARGGMDAWGFRNAAVPERAALVCVGDSQTFGTNVRAEDAYPSALAALSGLTVYNLSLGGYGPIQHLALLERALSLQPRAVVVGFYFGNDLLDAHRFAGLEHWAALRDPALAYAVPDDLPHGDDRSPNLTMALADGLLERSRVLGSLAEMLKLQLKVNPALAGLYWSDDRPLSYGGGNVRTHWTPAYRFRSVDLGQADVRDGLRILGLCLDGMQSACRARGVELVLLLIHTKEYAYQRWLAARDEGQATRLAALARAELAVRERVLALAAERSLRVVDPLPEILAALEADRALWPQSTDGHLNPEGCALLARVLWRELADGFAAPAPER